MPASSSLVVIVMPCIHDMLCSACCYRLPVGWKSLLCHALAAALIRGETGCNAEEAVARLLTLPPAALDAGAYVAAARYLVLQAATDWLRRRA